ncbi:carboxypeptidase-like regulatory domain-containing protein [Arachidicoccus ginsenosidivorans]|uniref:carboxypeptidase-like regulatory domain-containing protein n=1 Tax=Arachidicoccus ginsenosidivorans TaxID=496057 RepID=UPI001CEF7E21|nr:carboxypeptidase-like regulatory domain-containing protein [Arachidicoccus ginsenosidivorans]
MKYRYVLSLLLLLGFSLPQHLLHAQTSPVNGTVQSNSGTPLSGVSVRVLGGKATLTSNLGNFTLAAKIGDTLSFTYIGYEATQVVLTSLSAPLNVQLQQVSGELGEVVVTALGISKEKNRWAILSRKLNLSNSIPPRRPILSMTFLVR